MIKELRKRVGLTQIQVAENLGVSVRNYEYLENENKSSNQFRDVVLNYLTSIFNNALKKELKDKLNIKLNSDFSKIITNYEYFDIVNISKIIPEFIAKAKDKHVKTKESEYLGEEYYKCIQQRNSINKLVKNFKINKQKPCR